jgi:Bacterial TniB protein
VLAIDEIHNMIAGSWREQRVVLNTLRFLSNQAKLSPVCFGITEAREAINGDVQRARGFDVITLLRWKANEEFQQLVLAILRKQRRPPMDIRRAGCIHLTWIIACCGQDKQVKSRSPVVDHRDFPNARISSDA